MRITFLITEGTHMMVSPGTGIRRRFVQPPWDRNSPQWQDLDRQLAADHKARLIAAFVEGLDLTELEDLYRGSGSEAYPPEVMLKIALYETAEKHHSPSAWARHWGDSIPLQWLTMGCRPRRSALYAFRDRVGYAMDALLADVLDTARSEGFVEGETGVLDGTTIRAHASRHRLLNWDRLTRRLAELEQAVAADTMGLELSQPPGWMAATPSGRREQLGRYLKARSVLERRVAENARKPKDRRLDADKVMVTVSDPEAPLGRDKEGVFGPLYTAEFVVEPCSLLIMAFDVFAQATDAGTLPPMLDQVQAILGNSLQTIITDAGYVSILDLQACAQRQVELIAPVHENDFTPHEKAGGDQAAIDKSQFTWDAQEQTYFCPSGHRMKHVRQSPKARRHGEQVVIHQYQCPGEYCRECPLKDRCVKDPNKGRIVTRTEGEELLEEHRRRMQTPEAKKFRRLRGQVIERSFGDAKEHRGLRRLTGRGLHRARATVGLAVLVQNALTLHRLRQKAANPVEIAA
jgi:transposase